ncbi:hypothetical protein M0802_007530 [Mischocyttarus mexicanus]|nr:hypothetical protein M0802_007530 [Mischocyttarus mexicanus]
MLSVLGNCRQRDCRTTEPTRSPRVTGFCVRWRRCSDEEKDDALLSGLLRGRTLRGETEGEGSGFWVLGWLNSDWYVDGSKNDSLSWHHVHQKPTSHRTTPDTPDDDR